MDPLLIEVVPRDGHVTAEAARRSPDSSDPLLVPARADRARCALAVLPTVVRVRHSLRSSDDLEGAVTRLVVGASVQRALTRWPGPRRTDGAVRDALRILGRGDDDHLVRVAALYVLAVRQDWPAQLICGVAAAAGVRRVHAWFAADGCVIGELEPQPWVHCGEQFSLQHRPQRRGAPLGVSPSSPALHPAD